MCQDPTRWGSLQRLQTKHAGETMHMIQLQFCQKSGKACEAVTCY